MQGGYQDKGQQDRGYQGQKWQGQKYCPVPRIGDTITSDEDIADVVGISGGVGSSRGGASSGGASSGYSRGYVIKYLNPPIRFNLEDDGAYCNLCGSMRGWYTRGRWIDLQDVITPENRYLFECGTTGSVECLRREARTFIKPCGK